MKLKVNIFLWITTFLFLLWDFLLMLEFLTTNDTTREILHKNISHIIWQSPMSNDYCTILIYGLLILCVITYPYTNYVPKRIFGGIFVITIFYGIYRFVMAWIGLEVMCTMLHEF